MQQALEVTVALAVEVDGDEATARAQRGALYTAIEDAVRGLPRVYDESVSVDDARVTAL